MLIVQRTAHNKEPDAKAEERLIRFVANSNEIDVTAYGKRWGIETGYRMFEGLRLRTRRYKPSCKTCVLQPVLLYQWAILNARYGFVGKKWQGITFTMLQFKVVMAPDHLISPEPPHIVL